MVGSHHCKKLGSTCDALIGLLIGVNIFSLEHWNKVFVAKLTWLTVDFNKVLTCRQRLVETCALALLPVNQTSVPLSGMIAHEGGHRINIPVYLKTKLRIFEPLGCFIVFQQIPSWFLCLSCHDRCVECESKCKSKNYLIYHCCFAKK